MSKNLIFVIALFLFSTQSVEATEVKIIAPVLRQLDLLNDDVDKRFESMSDKLSIINEKIRNLGDDIDRVEEFREEFNKKYNEIIQMEANFSNFQEKWTSYLEENAKLRENIRSLENDIANLRSASQTSKSIVTWVTIIVSIIVVLLGAFFSRLILKMYGNYMVLAYKNKINEFAENEEK